MTATLTKEIELAGVYIEVQGDYDCDYVDNGIGPYEYWGAKGVHHDYGWEVQGCDSFDIIGDIKEAVTWSMKALGRTLRNRKWKKQRRQWARKVQAAFAKLDESDVFDSREIEEAAADQDPGPPEPDWDDIAERRRERAFDLD